VLNLNNRRWKVADKEFVRRKDIGIYKANKNVSGSVAQFKMANDNGCMFLELAKQVGDMDSEAPYDWEKSKIIVKLGIPDITKMLAYFRSGEEDKPLKLFHQNDKGSKSIEMQYQSKYNSFYLKVSSKEKKKDGDKVVEELKSVAVPISIDEVELLRVGMNRAIELILGW
jgi:hypothetical protein